MSKSKSSFSSVIVWVLMAVLVLGLAGFGVTNFGGQLRSLGTVGQTVIDATAYARALEQQLNAISAQTGGEFTFADAEAAGLTNSVMEQRIGLAALEEAARQASLSVGDDEVARRVREIPGFQGLNGEFDREAYSFALRNSGLTPESFEEGVRRDAASALLRVALATGMTPPATYGETLYRFVGEERTLTLAPLSADLLDTQPEAPTEAETRAYYDANPAQFTVPATRAITYVWLSPDMLIDQITPSEAELRAAYDARAALYDRPERRMLNQLGFADRAEAEAAKARIEAGEISFDDLLAERGLSEADVDLGALSKDALPAAAAEAIFALTDTGIAGPVDTDIGPSLFRVNAILSADFTPFEDAREELTADLALLEAGRLVGDEIEPLDDLLASGASLEELAAESDMELGQVEWSESLAAAEAPVTLQAFAAAAATVTANDFPEIVVAEDGSIFALRLDAEKPSTVLPLESMRAIAEDGAAIQKLTDALTARAEAMLADLPEGGDFASLGLTPTTREGLTRQTPAFDLPVVAQSTAFDMEAGETRVLSDAAGVWLVRLDSVTVPDASSDEAQAALAQLSQQTAQAMTSELIGQFATAIANEAGVQLDQTAINAVHTAFR